MNLGTLISLGLGASSAVFGILYWYNRAKRRSAEAKLKEVSANLLVVRAVSEARRKRAAALDAILASRHDAERKSDEREAETARTDGRAAAEFLRSSFDGAGPADAGRLFGHGASDGSDGDDD